MLGSFIALTATGNAEQALTFLDRALLTEPRNALAHNNRAVALAFLGRIEESRKAWTRSAELTPRSATHPVLNATRANQISPGRQNLRFAGEYLRAAEFAAAAGDKSVLAMIIWHMLQEEASFAPQDVLKLLPKFKSRSCDLRIPELDAMQRRVERVATETTSRLAQAMDEKTRIQSALSLLAK